MSRKKHKGSLPASPNPQTVERTALRRYQELLSPEEFTRLSEELAQPLRSAIRLNPFKLESPDAISDLAVRYGWQVQPVPYCPGGWWVESFQTSPSMTIEHRLGCYYIQDAASMLPAELFDLDDLPAPVILDMAASPGGKTTHLASRTGDRGILIANDSSLDRITALRLVLQNWGVISAAITQFPGEKFGAWYPETFDRILLDAPCSMESLRSTASHPMRPITPRERQTLAKRQSQLLLSALSAVKTGGQVVYSTCTLALEEDEAVLDLLLRQYPGVFKIENVAHRLPVASPGFHTDENHTYSPEVRNAVRLFPHHYRTSGFFAALLRKETPLSFPPEPPPARPLERTAFSPLSREEQSQLASRMQDCWGFDLQAILEKEQLCLWKNEARVFAFPQAFLARFSDFPVKSLGLAVGEGPMSDFLPAIEWVSRFYRQFYTGILQIPSSQVDAWSRGEDLPPSGGVHALQSSGPCGGVIIQDENGRLLGMGRQLPDRLRNLLPRRVVLSG